MAENIVHILRRLARPLLAALGIVGLFSTGASARPVPSSERLDLESRVRSIRQALQNSASHASQATEVDSGSQQPWGNWNNWGNWANAWNNWGNWGNWYNA